jgi:hypothetical protein
LRYGTHIGGVAAVGFAVLALISPLSNADNNLPPDNNVSAFDDCTNIEIEYEADAQLTRKERLSRMDDTFYESLSKFEACQRSASGGGGDGDGGGAAGGGGAGGGGAGGGAASPNMSGTDSSTNKNIQAQQGNSNAPTANKGSQTNALPTSNHPSPETASLTNGKLPDDIPPADNDSVLEAQIRQAAMSETDPAVKKKLWDEYRKYKGISRAEDKAVGD